VYAPFAAGDAMTRQGAVAHWLYIVISGTAEAWYLSERGEQILIETVEAGQVFGELGLMTGVPRANTVLAKTDVEAYRLDKSTFEAILRRRPELVEALTPRLLARQQQLDALRAAAHTGEPPSPPRHLADMLNRVKAFFSL
jgi:CRP-like cAMP-binding protein